MTGIRQTRPGPEVLAVLWLLIGSSLLHVSPVVAANSSAEAEPTTATVTQRSDERLGPLRDEAGDRELAELWANARWCVKQIDLATGTVTTAQRTTSKAGELLRSGSLSSYAVGKLRGHAVGRLARLDKLSARLLVWGDALEVVAGRLPLLDGSRNAREMAETALHASQAAQVLLHSVSLTTTAAETVRLAANELLMVHAANSLADVTSGKAPPGAVALPSGSAVESGSPPRESPKIHWWKRLVPKRFRKQTTRCSTQRGLQR